MPKHTHYEAHDDPRTGTVFLSLVNRRGVTVQTIGELYDPMAAQDAAHFFTWRSDHPDADLDALLPVPVTA